MLKECFKILKYPVIKIDISRLAISIRRVSYSQCSITSLMYLFLRRAVGGLTYRLLITLRYKFKL
jgi:hypothetical protein